MIVALMLLLGVLPARIACADAVAPSNHAPAAAQIHTAHNGCWSESDMLGISKAIAQYYFMSASSPTPLLPDHIALDDEAALLAYASEKLDIEASRLRLLRFGLFIVIHFEDPVYFERHARDWSVSKYGEGMVITRDRNHRWFRMSKT